MYLRKQDLIRSMTGVVGLAEGPDRKITQSVLRIKLMTDQRHRVLTRQATHWSVSQLCSP